MSKRVILAMCAIAFLLLVGSATRLTAIQETPTNLYLPIVPSNPTPTPTPTPTPSPLFVGLNCRWDGEGYIRTDEVYDVGTHTTRHLDATTDADTIRSRNQHWYDPNPKGWDADTWNTYYSISTGYFKSGTMPSDPDWKWGKPWILLYNWQFSNGQTVKIGGQPFRVSGPHSGYTAFGKAVQYWQLVNESKFVIWDGGGDWKQYVNDDYITLRYDAGRTGLLLHSNIIRRYYYKGDRTSYIVQYIQNLTSSTAFPDSGNATGLGQPVPSDDPDSSVNPDALELDSSRLPVPLY